MEPDVERRVRPGFERQIGRHGKIDRDRARRCSSSARQSRGAPVRSRSFRAAAPAASASGGRASGCAPNTAIAENRPVRPSRLPATRPHAQPEAPAGQPQIRPSAVKQAARRFAPPRRDIAAACAPAKPAFAQPARAAAIGSALAGAGASSGSLSRSTAVIARVGIAEMKKAELVAALVIAFEAVLGREPRNRARPNRRRVRRR